MYTYKYHTGSSDSSASSLQPSIDEVKFVQGPAPKNPSMAPDAVGRSVNTSEATHIPASSKDVLALPAVVAQASMARRSKRARSMASAQEEPCPEVRYFLRAIGTTVQERLAEARLITSAIGSQ